MPFHSQETVKKRSSFGSSINDLQQIALGVVNGKETLRGWRGGGIEGLMPPPEFRSKMNSDQKLVSAEASDNLIAELATNLSPAINRIFARAFQPKNRPVTRITLPAPPRCRITPTGNVVFS